MRRRPEAHWERDLAGTGRGEAARMVDPGTVLYCDGTGLQSGTIAPRVSISV